MQRWRTAYRDARSPDVCADQPRQQFSMVQASLVTFRYGCFTEQWRNRLALLICQFREPSIDNQIDQQELILVRFLDQWDNKETGHSQLDEIWLFKTSNRQLLMYTPGSTSTCVDNEQFHASFFCSAARGKSVFKNDLLFAVFRKRALKLGSNTTRVVTSNWSLSDTSSTLSHFNSVRLHVMVTVYNL